MKLMKKAVAFAMAAMLVLAMGVDTLAEPAADDLADYETEASENLLKDEAKLKNDGEQETEEYGPVDSETEIGEYGNKWKVHPDDDWYFGQQEPPIWDLEWEEWPEIEESYPSSTPDDETEEEPYIITREIRPAVKYVPYNVRIRNSNTDSRIEEYYSLTQGALPTGIEMGQNGELYGMPRETGSFTFTVEVCFESTGNAPVFPAQEATFNLIVRENTNEDVYYESDIEDGYMLSTPIGVETAPGNHDFYLEYAADSLFVSEGPFENFVDLWLNGERLHRNEDYIVEAGSTRITVIEQTMQNKAQNGNNTIAAEFRVSGDIDRNLRVTAQNFRIEKSGVNPGSVNPGGSGVSMGSSGTGTVAVATGDALAPGRWMVLMMLSITMLTGLVLFSKKKNRL